MTAVGDSKANRWHLAIANRWVVQYNFYINDRQWGRMFVRICPYLPFSARVCLNQHHWLANRLRAEGIAFRQCSNAFITCAAPARLQALAEVGQEVVQQGVGPGGAAQALHRAAHGWSSLD